jgi:hypothetical protein
VSDRAALLFLPAGTTVTSSCSTAIAPELELSRRTLSTIILPWSVDGGGENPRCSLLGGFGAL